MAFNDVSNAVGASARNKFTKATEQADEKHPPSEGFTTCTLLFCVGPMSLLGPIQDGLTGDIQILAIKSVMDGISTMTFATTFGWSVLFAAGPVLLYQGTLTLLASAVKQWLDALPEAALLLDSVTATGGIHRTLHPVAAAGDSPHSISRLPARPHHCPRRRLDFFEITSHRDCTSTRKGWPM